MLVGSFISYKLLSICLGFQHPHRWFEIEGDLFPHTASLSSKDLKPGDTLLKVPSSLHISPSYVRVLET